MVQRKSVRLGGKQLRVATKLSPATNAKRGFCPTCSGLGTHGKTKTGKAKPCGPCKGTGRAPDKTPADKKAGPKTTAKTTAKKTTTTPARQAPARTSAQTVAARRTSTAARTPTGRASGGGPRTAYGASAARRASKSRTTKARRRSRRRTMLRLLGIGGKRLPLRRAVRGWIRNTFGTRTMNTAQARRQLARNNDLYTDYASADGAWSWRCQLCPTWGDYGRNQLLIASDDMSNHMVEEHPGHTVDQKPHANFDHVDILYALNTRGR